MHLPHRLTLQTESRTEFQGGAYTTSWTTVSVIWGNIQCDMEKTLNDTSRNQFRLEKQQQFTILNIITRHNPDITTKNRLLYNNAIIQIDVVRQVCYRKRMISIAGHVEEV